MMLEIFVIPYDMIPKPLLPKFERLRKRNHKSFLVFPGEIHLERVHDAAKIVPACRLNNRMEMVGQENIAQQNKGV